MSLSDDLAEQLLTAIIDGRYPPNSALPPEGELSEQGGISRLTVREAVKQLRAQNVVRVVRGRGTYVNPPDRWTALEPVVRAASRTSGALSERLIEARRLIENGACELAASRRTEEDLDALRQHLDVMRKAAEAGDTEQFVKADIDFHDTVMRATGNLFVPLLFEPFGPLLVEGRRETSAVPEIRDNAIAHHVAVLAALESGSPEAARTAMDAHMNQTADDLRAHVIKRDGD
ncbi:MULTISPECIES: FadR/GntR family transcriptional regulator [unclassified Streptomyces]|uniref:FadR/GntR family transcriptional regulator n=1 Tax=unclassified Streptomyces TaxID=2593676 RepID=UPI002DDAA653|nr:MULTISPECIES: FadR/GntR family transcriptional regulator [unclassified Streptomyces]WSF82385.1 FadR family transcriptional regulator [Streptomyces sp. NBC_01744]WSC41322.1 FadR family transcriptional regulator [Streptomyces sp. NBC_01763]WSC49710.1 FadR family transcriptional regulator [Streptomyces sp. NBC_01762]WSC51534.1 FadR family transcriptional regulator [Streptomyces sp. NBC_01761]WSD29286.1 FadR family transcriptional regulator [Streptomyces sp. NBC_01751]